MDEHRMFALATGLGVAKSRQDVRAALEYLHPDMLLTNPAFGTSARGLEANEQALVRWFRSFPDYQVTLEGRVSDKETMVCWGTVRMTITGDRFGVVPNGRRAELPVYIQFTFRDDLITSERFFFDLSALCAQSGVSTDAVRRTLFGAAHEPAAEAVPNA